MPNFKKTVRDKMRSVLSDGTNGFNAKLAAIASGYGVQPFSIDFDITSTNFIQAYVTDDRDIEVSSMVDFPGMILYTTTAINENLVKFQKFSGQVLAHVAVYLRYRALTDAQTADNDITQAAAMQDTESMADAVCDAMLEAVWTQRGSMSQGGMSYPGNFRCDPDPVTIFGDGYGQRILFTFGFNIHA